MLIVKQGSSIYDFYVFGTTSPGSNHRPAWRYPEVPRLRVDALNIFEELTVKFWWAKKEKVKLCGKLRKYFCKLRNLQAFENTSPSIVFPQQQSLYTLHSWHHKGKDDATQTQFIHTILHILHLLTPTALCIFTLHCPVNTTLHLKEKS